MYRDAERETMELPGEAPPPPLTGDLKELSINHVCVGVF